MLRAQKSIVSVPSRGILFPNERHRIYDDILNEWFPSPLGVSYFQISRPNNSLNCFRPFCFRPLSGYLISKYEKDGVIIAKGNGFPSPLGVSYFQMNFQKRYWHQAMFPSPLGVSYFQIVYHDHLTFFWFSFPSPLGVSYFQIMADYWEDKKGNSGFRPLSGYLISKSDRKYHE